MTKPQIWLNFGNVTVKKRDIDYFARDWKKFTLTCHYHQGQSYMHEAEVFHAISGLEARQLYLNKQLGIEAPE